jgi:hypothetical protein
MKKICCRCNVEKDVDDFNNLKSAKDGKKYYCRECQKKESKEYKSRPEVIKKIKEFNQTYKERHNELSRKNYNEYKKFDLSYKEKAKKSKKKYYSTENGKKRKSIWDKAYREKNKEKIKLRRRNNMKNPYYLLTHRLRSRFKKIVNRYVIECKEPKTKMAKEFLGCDIIYYKEYIESLFLENMNWENYGEWHIDHIIPISYFDLTIEEELRKAFYFKNTRPLWAHDNLSKGAKIENK